MGKLLDYRWQVQHTGEKRVTIFDKQVIETCSFEQKCDCIIRQTANVLRKYVV